MMGKHDGEGRQSGEVVLVDDKARSRLQAGLREEEEGREGNDNGRRRRSRAVASVSTGSTGWSPRSGLVE